MNRFIALGKKIKQVPVLHWVIILAVFLAGLFLSPSGSQNPGPETKAELSENEATIWTCSMHPQIKLPKPGQCPICFMDLIPLKTTASEVGPNSLKLSDAAISLAEIETRPAARGVAKRRVALSGKIEFDETRVKTITAWVSGRLEHLYVDYTGIQVRKGDHLVDIYSPELSSAQEELLQALALSKNSGIPTSLSRETLAAAREKLKLAGLNSEQIKEIETRGTVQDQITITSPISGIVIHKNAVEGMYVNTGTKIYTIADLSRVWVLLDAYESDLSWLRFGQDVTFTTEALPGETFSGRIAFIDPVLDNQTRTVKVRINLANPRGILKPGMFIRATSESILDASGKAVNTALAGKWIGPMHPEIVKEKPGICDICGMELKKAEDLGIVSQPKHADLPLLVPASAVLKTGKRTLVYVRVPGTDAPTFESREISLGPRAGDQYIVLGGLAEGEAVVVKGNFKIDSAMQIAAKPSMMNAKGGAPMTGHANHGAPPEKKSKSSNHQDMSAMEMDKPETGEAFNKALALMDDSYLIAQEALAKDDFKAAKSALYALKIILTATAQHDYNLDKNSAAVWNSARSNILKSAEHAEHWSTIDPVRVAFSEISREVTGLAQSFNLPGTEPLYEIFCPMAFDNKGAAWLQNGKIVRNPYLGQKMPRCGELKTEYKPLDSMNETMGQPDHE